MGKARSTYRTYPLSHRARTDIEIGSQGTTRPAKGQGRTNEQKRKTSRIEWRRRTCARGKHATQGHRSPPFPTGVGVSPEIDQGAADRRVTCFERGAAPAADADRNNLLHHTLRAVTAWTRIRQRRPVHGSVEQERGATGGAPKGPRRGYASQTDTKRTSASARAGRRYEKGPAQGATAEAYETQDQEDLSGASRRQRALPPTGPDRHRRQRQR